MTSKAHSQRSHSSPREMDGVLAEVLTEQTGSRATRRTLAHSGLKPEAFTAL